MSNRIEKLLNVLRVTPGRQINLGNDYDPGYIDHFMSKEDATASLEEGIRLLPRQQDILFAQNTYALLINLQAMDAAGKDSTIKHVMSGVNPQGVQVTSFKGTERGRTRSRLSLAEFQSPAQPRGNRDLQPLLL